MASPPGYDYVYGFHLFDDLHNFFPELLYDDVLFDHDSLGWMRHRLSSYFPAVYTRQSNMYRIWHAQARRAQFDEWRATHLLTNNPSIIRPPPPRDIPREAIPQRIQRTQFVPRTEETTYLSTLNAVFQDLSGTMAQQEQQEQQQPPRHTTMIFTRGDQTLLSAAGQGSQTSAAFIQNIMDLLALASLSDVVVAPSQVEINDASQILHNHQISAEFICPICQEHTSNTEGNAEWRRLACSHTFHQICIDRWLTEHTQCPMCRADVRDMTSI